MPLNKLSQNVHASTEVDSEKRAGVGAAATAATLAMTGAPNANGERMQSVNL